MKGDEVRELDRLWMKRRPEDAGDVVFVSERDGRLTPTGSGR